MTRLSSPAAALPRRFLLGLPALFAARFAHGQAFPEKPIKIVVAYAPGGAADVMARGVAQEMAKRLGVSVLVENRSGATGAIGAQVVATAAPDGHTLLFASGSEISVQPLVQKSCRTMWSVISFRSRLSARHRSSSRLPQSSLPQTCQS